MAHRFRIYYTDGSTYEGDPFQARRWGVQLILQDEGGERGPRTLHGREYFCWSKRMGPGWVNMDLAGMIQYALFEMGPVVVLLGEVTDNATFAALRRRAKEDGL